MKIEYCILCAAYVTYKLDDSSEYLRYPLGRAESEDITPRSRRSTTFGGQIDTQRGLLNRETLTLPKFLTPDYPPSIDDDDSFNKHRLDNVSNVHSKLILESLL